MTGHEFRLLALSMPDAVEHSHMQHPDYRVGGRIFATFGSPNEGFAMLKLTPEEQTVVIAAEPGVFSPAAGAWGRNGSTLVRLHAARETTVRSAMQLAYAAMQAKASTPARPRKRRA